MVFSHSLQSNGRGNTFVTRSRHVTSRKRRLNSTCNYMCFHWVFNSAHRATKIDYEENDATPGARADVPNRRSATLFPRPCHERPDLHLEERRRCGGAAEHDATHRALLR